MGIFSFAKDIGDKIFGEDDADPADKIKLNIEEYNPGIEELDVSMDGDTVVLNGSSETAEAKEKAVLMAGNMMGVAQVDADAVSAPPPVVEPQQYTISSGDTLWKIAEKLLGDGNRYTELFEANKEVIKDPDKIYPGQVIRIPSA